MERVALCLREKTISPRKENGNQKKVFNIISSKVTKVLAIDVRTRKDLKKKKTSELETGLQKHKK